MLKSRYLPLAIYVSADLAILGPLIQTGYALSLDLVFTPKLHLPLNLGSSLLPNVLMNAFNWLVPGQLIEKALLLSIFTLAGLGMHAMVSAHSNAAKYASGLLYTINPFTYAHFATGQYLMLAGYALMPWYLSSLISFCQRPTRKCALKLAAWSIAIGFISLHYLGFAALSAAIAVSVTGLQARHRSQKIKPLLAWSAAVLAAIFIVNSFWLIPTALGHTTQSQLITSFTDRYFLAFHTTTDPHFGQIFNTLAMYGFWGDDQGIYRSPKAAAPWWWIIAIFILVVAAIGAITRWRNNRFTISLMLILGGIALILAQGIMGSPFASFNYWLMQHVWIYRAYREPGKFVGLLALAICYLFGLGADWLLELTKNLEWGRGALTGLLIALPFAYTPTMLWGAAGQLHAVNYPKDWYALNQKLDAEHSPGKVLFLPWHQYMYFRFAGRIIANPASRFFDRTVIQGDNAEIGLIEYQSESPISRTIQTQILSPDTGQRDLGPRLHTLGIEYVVLAKEADYQNYQWLDHSSGLTLTSDTATLQVYKVEP